MRERGTFTLGVKSLVASRRLSEPNDFGKCGVRCESVLNIGCLLIGTCQYRVFQG